MDAEMEPELKIKPKASPEMDPEPEIGPKRHQKYIQNQEPVPKWIQKWSQNQKSVQDTLARTYHCGKNEVNDVNSGSLLDVEMM